jgi:hypothetical protein
VSQVTVVDWVVVVGQAASPGETVTVTVTGPGAAGQVNTGVALAGLSKVPALAVHAKVGLTLPADAVAEKAMDWPTVVSAGEKPNESMLAQTSVEAVTATLPASARAPVQNKRTATETVTPAVTLNDAEPTHVSDPSVETPLSVIS